MWTRYARRTPQALSKKNKQMKTTIILVTIALSILCMVILPDSRIEEAKVEFYKEALFPVEQFVESTKNKLGRLPTKKEFEQWREINYPKRLIVFYTEKPPFITTWGELGNSYLIGAWKSDDVLYFCSWDKKLFYDKLY